MNKSTKGAAGWTGLAGLLYERATSGLNALDGAFSLTSADWTVVAYTLAILAAIAGIFWVGHIPSPTSTVDDKNA